MRGLEKTNNNHEIMKEIDDLMLCMNVYIILEIYDFELCFYAVYCCILCKL